MKVALDIAVQLIHFGAKPHKKLIGIETQSFKKPFNLSFSTVDWSIVRTSHDSMPHFLFETKTE